MIERVEQIVDAVRQDNPGIARGLLSELEERIKGLSGEDDAKGEAMTTLMRIWTCGDVEFCEEALGRITSAVPNDVDRDMLKGMYGHSLEYIRGGRDPYYLESLQPDVRMVTEKLVGAFDTGQTGF